MKKGLGMTNMNGITDNDRTCGLNDMNCLSNSHDKTCGLNDMNCMGDDKVQIMRKMAGKVYKSRKEVYHQWRVCSFVLP